MLPYEELQDQALTQGFTHCVPLDVSTIRLLPAVREMCEKNTCKAYGTSWSCPPAVGTLQECQTQIDAFREGILVQTVGTLEDPFDLESMMRIMSTHLTCFDRLHMKLLARYPNMLALGAGSCTRCEVCTYPDSPCRHPELACGSMEGYGMLVTEVCKSNNLGYYYGQGTMSYTSCFLLQ